MCKISDERSEEIRVFVDQILDKDTAIERNSQQLVLYKQELTEIQTKYRYMYRKYFGMEQPIHRSVWFR